jgi:hypothetical protein
VQRTIRRALGRLGAAGLSTALVLPLLALGGPASAVTAPSRATWVWTRPAPAALVTWAVRRGVGELFVSVDTDLPTSPDRAWVRSVVARAHAAGIRVAALGGDADWVDRPQDALAWQRAVVGTRLFDGVHLDIEPWVRDDWDSRRSELVAAYVDVLRRLAAATRLPVEADIAFWLHQLRAPSGRPLDETVMRLVDSVTVMSYRHRVTGADSITGLGAHELATAARLRKPCRLAVETNHLGDDAVSRKQTFHGLGAQTLNRALRAVDAAERHVPSYRGIAVHDFDGWRALR